MNPAPKIAPQDARAFQARLDSLLARVDRLPTLPAIFWEILAQLQNPENSAVDLADVIENDPSLAANILRLANSAYYGFSSRFISIIDAVVAIGRREIEQLASATIIIDTFGIRDPRKAMDYTRFWIHCIQVAAAAEFISSQHVTNSPYPPVEAYLGGLLHDIGKLILNQFLSDDWIRVRAFATSHACSDADAELATLGLDHGEIGARLLEVWEAAPNIVEGTRFHHRLSGGTGPRFAAAGLIAFADSICHAFERGSIPEKPIPHPRFSLDQRQAELLAKALEKATKRASVLIH